MRSVLDFYRRNPVVLVVVVVIGLAVSIAAASSNDGGVVLPIVFLAGPPLNLRLLVAGFLLFRLFDIWKPGLAREAERLPRGWGIVADDVVAAALAWAALRGVLWLDGVFGFDWLAASA